MLVKLRGGALQRYSVSARGMHISGGRTGSPAMSCIEASVAVCGDGLRGSPNSFSTAENGWRTAKQAAGWMRAQLCW